MSTVHKLLFFKTSDMHTLDIKIWKNILSSHESEKQILWIRRLLKHHQLRISENCSSLQIILNVFKCFTVLISIQILILFWLSHPFLLFQLAFSVNLLCCQICTFYCPLRKKRCTLFPEWTDVHIWQHIPQKSQYA